MIVFTSDNGMFWGEHRLRGKSQVYEEAIGVPFVVRYDTLIENARTDQSLALNIDLAPTFAELAGVIGTREPRAAAFFLACGRRAPRGAHAFLVEHMVTKGSYGAPTFCAIHTDRYVLVQLRDRRGGALRPGPRSTPDGERGDRHPDTSRNGDRCGPTPSGSATRCRPGSRSEPDATHGDPADGPGPRASSIRAWLDAAT